MSESGEALGTIKFLYNNPFAVFIILSGLFGYGYYEQGKELTVLSTEVGALRAEQSKMNEIIKLKVEIASKQCNVGE